MWKKAKHLLQNEKIVRLIMTIGLLGMLCIGISSCFSKPEADTATEPIAATDSASVFAETIAYKEAMEQQLEELLSGMQGVGACEVLLTISETPSYSYAKDETSRISEEKSEREFSYVRIGNGEKERALMESVSEPQIQGVLVVCEGGDNHVVKEQIYAAMEAILQLKSTQIFVAKAA